jgi:hypothetical protein
MTYFFEALGDIATCGLKVGWPLLLSALGLASVAYYGGKDKVKTTGGWVLAFVSFLLFFFTLRK